MEASQPPSDAHNAADAAIAVEHADRDGLLAALNRISGFDTLEPEVLKEWLEMVMEGE